jgi:hypothetical protein
VGAQIEQGSGPLQAVVLARATLSLQVQTRKNPKQTETVIAWRERFQA